MSSRPLSHTALAGASLGVGGVLFALYQAIRPFTDTPQTMASSAWVLSHTLAIVGFVLISAALLALPGLRTDAAPRAPAVPALVLAWLGTGPVLAYYGAETFGLWVIARAAVREDDPSLVDLATEFHQATLPTVLFAGGLALLGVAGVLTAVVAARSAAMPRWSGVPFALGLLLLIPQFYTPQPVRIVHGILLAAGCVWLAAAMVRARRGGAKRVSALRSRARG